MVRIREGSGECMYSAMQSYEGKNAPTQLQAVEQWTSTLASEAQALETAAADLPDRLAACARSAELRVVVGAGLSIACGLPGWQELVERVFGQVLGARGLREYEAESLLRSATATADPLALAQAATALASEDELTEMVRESLYRTEPKRSELLKAIGRLVAALHSGTKPVEVLTFNYDTLLEDELTREGISVQTVDRAGNADGFAGVTVHHLHGILPPPGTSAGAAPIVLSEVSYGQAYLAAGGDDPLSDIVGAGLLPLFVGFSFRDTYVRQILLRAKLASGRPVAVTCASTLDLVGRPKLVHADWQNLGYTENERMGHVRTGLDPVEARAAAIDRMPAWFARWVLDAIGVEVLEAETRRDLAAALRSVARAVSSRSRRPARA